MKKDFIRDSKGRVTNCDANISKFSIWQWAKYNNYGLKGFFFPVEFPSDFAISLLRFILYISQIIPLWWILSCHYAKKSIKRAKKEVERNNKIRQKNDNRTNNK